jgi:hypothetical protein
MDWIDLGNPTPRTVSTPYAPLQWPKGNDTVPAHATRSVPGPLFLEVLRRRRSCREFAAVRVERMVAMVGELLWTSCRTQVVGSDSLGFPISLRPTPSAGAIHPIHIIVNVPGHEYWHRFDPDQGRLVELPTSVRVDDVRASLDVILYAPNAALILFVAEPAMTAAKYEQSASLVWRDAGVVQGLLAVTAEALNMGCVLLGVTGDPWSRQLLEQRGLQGVGAAFVGSPAGRGHLHDGAKRRLVAQKSTNRPRR